MITRNQYLQMLYQQMIKLVMTNLLRRRKSLYSDGPNLHQKIRLIRNQKRFKARIRIKLFQLLRNYQRMMASLPFMFKLVQKDKLAKV